MPSNFRRGWPLASLALCGLGLASPAHADLTDDQDPTAFDYPVVITPTRLKQSLADVPGSVSIITAETIRHHGITTIPDALRLVPGMAVTQTSGNDYRVNYHGTGVVTPRRMNVLINGFAAYGTALSLVDWNALPVSIEDVERIEVTRGPDSAAYGPNSMLGVINIITKDPRDIGSGELQLSGGSHGNLGTMVRGAMNLGEATRLALTADTTRNNGYDEANVKGGAHDGSRVQRLNLRTRTELDARTTLDLQALHVDGFREVAYVYDPNQTTFPNIDTRRSSLTAKWSRAISDQHDVEVRALATSNASRQDWQTCWWQFMLNPTVVDVVNRYPALGGAFSHGLFSRADSLPQLLSFASQLLSTQDQMALISAVMQMGGPAAALQNVCGTTDNHFDEQRVQLEVQDTYVFNDRLRMVSGAGLRNQRADSSTMLSGSVTSNVRWLFGHGEYRATDALTLNAGGYFESSSLGRDTFSPRVAANYRLSPSHTLRAVFSRGTRSPDMLESRGNWAPTMYDLSPNPTGQAMVRTFSLLRGNPQLSEERDTAIEFGHVMALPQFGMVIDNRVFEEKLTNLISNYSASTQLSPNNDTGVRLAGAESQVSWAMSANWSGWMNYAYLVNYQATNNVERTQWSRHSGSVGVSHRWDDQWRTSVSTVHASGDGYRESRYGRTDLTLQHDTRAQKLDIHTSFTLSYLHTPCTQTYIGDYSGTAVSSYNSHLGLFGKVRIGF